TLAIHKPGFNPTGIVGGGEALSFRETTNFPTSPPRHLTTSPPPLPPAAEPPNDSTSGARAPPAPCSDHHCSYSGAGQPLLQAAAQRTSSGPVRESSAPVPPSRRLRMRPSAALPARATRAPAPRSAFATRHGSGAEPVGGRSTSASAPLAEGFHHRLG